MQICILYNPYFLEIEGIKAIITRLLGKTKQQLTVRYEEEKFPEKILTRASGGHRKEAVYPSSMKRIYNNKLKCKKSRCKSYRMVILHKGIVQMYS